MGKPFVKWAGGKTALLGELEQLLPKTFGTYHEPFVGGGALFFHLQELGFLKHGVSLNDLCSPLIDTYAAVRDDVELLIQQLLDRKAEHSESLYYDVRSAVNKMGWNPADFIYINRTCFNGLYRENAKGEFNVPIGSYKNPRICDPVGLRAASQALQNVQLTTEDFEVAANRAEPGDLVYFDPPYVPIKVDSFTEYQGTGFGMAEQERLAACAEALVARGVHVMLSNSDTAWVSERYQKFVLRKVMAPRQVAAKTKNRAPVSELILVGVPK